LLFFSFGDDFGDNKGECWDYIVVIILGDLIYLVETGLRGGKLFILRCSLSGDY
jgi:hypothetical protein